MFSKSALDDFSKWQICTCFGCFGAPDKPCGVGCADVNPKTVAKRYKIVQKVVSLHYESEWQ